MVIIIDFKHNLRRFLTTLYLEKFYIWRNIWLKQNFVRLKLLTIEVQDIVSHTKKLHLAIYVICHFISQHLDTCSQIFNR